MIRWRKRKFREFWRKKSGSTIGRPAVPRKHIEFIRRISSDHLAVRGESRVRSRARDLCSLARHEKKINAWSLLTTRNTASGRKPLVPFGLRAAQAHLLCCPSSPMLDISCVGSPYIWTHGARNATRGTSTTGC